MDNLIRLKELQVVGGALRKGDKGLGFFFLFSQKGFFGWGGEDGVIPPLFNGVFLGGIGRGGFFFGMGCFSRGCFLGGMGRKSLVVFQGRKAGVFFCFLRN